MAYIDPKAGDMTTTSNSHLAIRRHDYTHDGGVETAQLFVTIPGTHHERGILVTHRPELSQVTIEDPFAEPHVYVYRDGDHRQRAEQFIGSLLDEQDIRDAFDRNVRAMRRARI